MKADGQRRSGFLNVKVRGISALIVPYTAKRLHSAAQGRVVDAHPGSSTGFHAYAEGVIQIWRCRRAIVKPLQGICAVGSTLPRVRCCATTLGCGM